MSKVFVSGSISIKSLPTEVLESLNNIKDKNLEVLVGDADGIDKLIQNYFLAQNYNNICVYSIYDKPRNIRSQSFQKKIVPVSDTIKRERERQMFKDKQMSEDSDFSLIIWDGKSKGSYNNILRAIEQDKKAKVYLSTRKKFLEQKKINKNEVDYIFYENNGYSAKEVVEYFIDEGKDYFKNTRQLNKYLLDNKIIEKKDKVYVPLENHKLFIIEKYRGQVSGLKFNNLFIDWIENKMKGFHENQQESLF